MPGNAFINLPGCNIPPSPPQLNTARHGNRPGKITWAILTLVVIAVLIFVWWALA